MSSRSKESLALQVFPFLAVLVCTMGSLIFLLLVTTRQIRERAVAFAAYAVAQQELAAAESVAPPPAAEEPEPEPEPAPIIVIPPQPVRKSKPVKLPNQDYALALANREREQFDLNTKWKLRVDQLVKTRNGHRQVLDRHRQQITETIDGSNALKSEVDRLETQLGQVSGEAAEISTLSEKEEEARRQLEKQILELKKQLRAAEVAELTDSEKFQVIPFDPLTGTTRRPIFLECTDEGIRFLPEDITITAADLAGFTNRVNPLAAGTGALINYWAARHQHKRNANADQEPYVLILVRPSGICAYYVAMKMLESIRTQHGYELIDDSISLQIPEVDAGAKAACQAAVDRLLAERENVFRSAMNTGGGGTVFGTGPRGTATNLGRGSGNGGSPYSERMAGARRGEGNLFTISDVTGEDSPDRESNSWDPIENFKGPPPRRTGGTVSRGGSGGGAGGGGGSGAGGGGGSGGSGVNNDLPPPIVQGTGRGSSSRGKPSDDPAIFGRTTGSSRFNGTSPFDDESSETNRAGGRSGSDVITADLSNPTPGGSGATNGRSGGTEGSGRTGGRTGSGGSVGSGGNGDSSGTSGPGGPSGSGSGRSGDRSGRQNGSGGSSRGSSDSFLGSSGLVNEMPVGQRPGKKRGQPTNAAGVDSDGQGSDSSDDPSYATGGGAGGPGGPGSGPQSGGAPSSNMLSDNPSSSPRRANGSKLSSNSSGGPQKSKPSRESENKQLEPEMLAGRRWGFSEQGASIGFEREVRVDVDNDKFIIAEKYVIPIKSDETRQEMFEQFATSLDRYSHEWGRPPQGFFWTPRLKFTVKPEASAHYEQLNSLMTRAGMSTTHEFAKTDAKIEFGGEPLTPVKPASKAANRAIPGGQP